MLFRSDASSQIIELEAKEQGKTFQEYIKYISQWRDIWKQSNDFDSVLRDERTWKPAAFLMRKKGARLLHDHIIIKPKTASHEIPWHQDYSFWCVLSSYCLMDSTRCVDNPGGLSCWIPMEDVGMSQGCLEVIDGVCGTRKYYLMNSRFSQIGRKPTRRFHESNSSV